MKLIKNFDSIENNCQKVKLKFGQFHQKYT